MAWSNLVVLIGIAMAVAFRLSESLFRLMPFWVVFALIELLFLCYPISTRIRRRPAIRIRMPSFKRVIIESLWAALLIVVYLCLSAAVRWLVTSLGYDPGYPRELEELTKTTDYGFFALYAISGVLLAPLSEEVFFRGFLFNAISKRKGVFVGIIVSSMLFGFGHSYSNLYMIVEICFVGVFLCLIYNWRKTLLTPVLFHTGFNLIAMLGLLAALLGNMNAPMIGVTFPEPPEPCVVQSVLPGSPADDAGIIAGDKITGLNEYQIRHGEDL